MILFSGTKPSTIAGKVMFPIMGFSASLLICHVGFFKAAQFHPFCSFLRLKFWPLQFAVMTILRELRWATLKKRFFFG